VQDPALSRVAQPKLIFCTAAGALGVIANVEEEVAQILAKVERNIVKLIETHDAGNPRRAAQAGIVSGLSYRSWRTARTDHRVQDPIGFIDGNIVQMLVDGRLNGYQKDLIFNGPESSTEAINVERDIVEKYIEDLRQLH
jgi:hypothetical protein